MNMFTAKASTARQDPSSGSVGWKQRQTLIAEDWKIHYPVFHQLYMIEQQTLENTMRIMEERLDFTATKKMYKTKITQWGLRKYGKVGGLARGSGPALQVGDDINQAVTYKPQSSVVSFPKHVLSPTLLDDRVELVLRCVAGYSNSCLEDRATLPWKFTNSSRTWTEQMIKSIAFLSLSESHRARATLDSACTIADQIMTQPCNDFLQNILIVFLRGWWLTFPLLRLNLFRYLMKLASLRLGSSHPLTIALFHLMDNEVVDHAAESAMQIAITAAEKECPSINRSAWTLNHSFCCLLLGRKEYRAAEVRIARLLHESIQSYGIGHPLTRSVVLRQGDLYDYLGQWVEAQKQYEDAIQQANHRYGNPFPDPVGIEAYARLAKVHEKQGNLLTAQELCTTALNNPWTPLSDDTTSRTMVALKAMLEETLLVAMHAQQTLADSERRHRGNEMSTLSPKTTHHRRIYKDINKVSSCPRDQTVDSRPKLQRHVAVISHGHRWELLSDFAKKFDMGFNRWEE